MFQMRLDTSLFLLFSLSLVSVIHIDLPGNNRREEYYTRLFKGEDNLCKFFLVSSGCMKFRIWKVPKVYTGFFP